MLLFAMHKLHRISQYENYVYKQGTDTPNTLETHCPWIKTFRHKKNDCNSGFEIVTSHCSISDSMQSIMKTDIQKVCSEGSLQVVSLYLTRPKQCPKTPMPFLVCPTRKDMGLVGHLTWNAKHSFRSCIKVHGTPTLSRRNQRKLQATTSKTSILDANGRFLGTN